MKIAPIQRSESNTRASVDGGHGIASGRLLIVVPDFGEVGIDHIVLAASLAGAVGTGGPRSIAAR